MKYHLLHLGCQMNQSDAERIRTVIEAMGYRSTDEEKEADLLGVIACSVRQKAIDKVYSKISQWNDWKRNRNLLTFVSGCILPADREKFLDRFDLLFSINDLPDVPEMISQYGIVTPTSLDLGLRDPYLEDDKQNGPKESIKKLRKKNGTAQITPTPQIPTQNLIEGKHQYQKAGPMWLANPKAPGLAFTPERYELESRSHLEADEKRKSTLAAIRAMQAELKEQGGSQLIKKAVAKDTEVEDPMGGFWNIRPDYSSAFEAFIPIQNGCDKFCTFCAVPYTRGREISRPSSEILEEVQNLIDRGYKSITLLGQNVNSYGLDRSGSEITFPELMRAIGEMGKSVKQKFWVYFTSPHPRDMSKDLIDVIAEYDCLAKQIHLPIQSGDDKVLIKMNRNHSTARYREVVNYIQEKIPTATLFTDIIVGFTGEEEKQFLNTKKAMEEFQYNMAYIAVYSPRPGAASSRWADTVEQNEKKRRFQILSEVLQKTSRAKNEAMLGSEQTILVDRPDRKKGYLSGKTEGKLIVRFASENENLIGSFVRVRITDCANLSLEGELIHG